MKRTLIVVGCFLAAAAAFAGEQARPSGRPIPTVTRNVQIFSELENDWIDAVQKHDVAALGKLMAQDFEMRTAAEPGVPTAREEWAKQALAGAPFQSSIEQMAVHEYGDLMVVSFLWKIASNDATLPKSVFVVDTWKRTEGNWQVLVRYAAPVGEGAGSIPGAAPPSAQSARKKF